MSIQFIERKQTQIPTAKTIIIDGRELGTAEPSFHGDRLSWHASIKLEDPRILCRLVQGHGPSPHSAVADGIIKARADRDALIEKLAWLEEQLGTTGKSEDDLRRSVI